MKQVFINTRIKGGTIVTEQEFDLDKIQYENGRFVVDDRKFDIVILGDEGNIPKRLEKEYEDGYPRLICDYYGNEHAWMLDDIVLFEI